MNEKEKYETMHTTESYKTQNMGLYCMQRFLDVVPPTSTIADYGAGNGLSTIKLSEHYSNVIPVDIASNAGSSDLPNFVQANLWEDNLPNVDWGFCTDVMEHIPTDYVDQVLKNIAKSVKDGCYFQINTTLDISGPAKLGIHLHLTVETPEQWKTRLLKCFNIVDSEFGSIVSHYVCKHKG